VVDTLAFEPQILELDPNKQNWKKTNTGKLVSINRDNITEKCSYLTKEWHRKDTETLLAIKVQIVNIM
jgi:hypothetical protein